KETVELKPGEITLSLSGFSNENTHLVFSKRLHAGSYASPKGCGVFGRIVYGRHLLNLLKIGDRIEKIDPVIETKVAADAVVKATPDYVVQEPVQIFTHLKIDLEPNSPLAGEHAYNVFEPKYITVSRRTSRFVACDDYRVTSLTSEKIDLRKRGTVTVRTEGNDSGSLYVYLLDVPIGSSHTKVGHISSGLDLADVAGVGDKIAVVVEPKRLDILGKTHDEARELLEKHGIKMKRSGDSSDTALIAQHNPQNTLDIYKKGEVDCFGISQSQLVMVRFFYDSAPNSIRYFKRVTGLELRRFGLLKVYFSTSKMDMILFKGDEALAKGLLPENTPTGSVNTGVIGVTNAVKKFTGMIGVRFTTSDRFGPTAESFEGTNIIGEVIENLEMLKGLKDGKEAYVVEGPK
ncbi:MAG: methanogenesis marker 3 protein, partial [Candidatus Methanomethylicus sp.]|nr:methanogenesis marker 3 protein [Candidatus Methanomethylicus sp.]